MDRGNVETKQSLTNTWPETNMNINNFKAIGYVNLFLKKTHNKTPLHGFYLHLSKKNFFFFTFFQKMSVSHNHHNSF